MSRRALFGRLAGAERVVQISAPAASGKTVLMRSWIAEAGLARQAAWVPANGEVGDPRPFWVWVADALRGTSAGSGLVQPLTAAPDVDGGTTRGEGGDTGEPCERCSSRARCTAEERSRTWSLA